MENKMLEGQLNLFKSLDFESKEEQKEFARRRLRAVTAYLEGQGVPPLFTAHALLELQKEINDRGLEDLKKRA